MPHPIPASPLPPTVPYHPDDEAAAPPPNDSSDSQTVIDTPSSSNPDLATSRGRRDARPRHEPDEALEHEIALREQVGLEEKPRHGAASGSGERRGVSGSVAEREAEGVMEKRVVVDLGDGPEEVVVIDWRPGDPGNPFNWPMRVKVIQVCVTTIITALTAMNLTAVSIMASWGTERFGVSAEVYTLSLTLPLFAIALTPMALAPFSELFGRMMIYQVTSVVTTLLFLPQIFSSSFAGLLISRWFQGMTTSVGNSMVGGTVADIFDSQHRGTAMVGFTWMTFFGQAIGGLLGWVGMYHGIQWCYGVLGLLNVLSCILNFIFLRETRSSVILSRRARRLTKETGTRHVCASDLERTSFATIMRVSIVRPFQFLLTEPIVSAISLWIGFNWGCVLLSTASVLLVFRQYGFSEGQAGSTLMTIAIGATLGVLSNYHQEYLFRRACRRSPTGKAPPEARLYWAACGALLFPLSFYVFAWTGRPSAAPWEVPALFLCFSMWGVFVQYAGVFTYLADAYETYSSSAQAAQSFARNSGAAFFPLFARAMYDNLGYPQASSMIASISLVLGVCPFFLLRYGARLRARSKVATALAREHEQEEASHSH